MRLFVSVLSIGDIGGISTSIQNFLNEISKQNEVDLCVLCNYISPNVEIPKNVHIIPGSKTMEYSYIGRDRMRCQNALQKTVRNIIRLWRRVVGLQRIIDYSLKKLTVCGHYDVAISFTNDLYKNGKIWVGGTYDLVKRNINADIKVAWIHNDAVKCGFTPDISQKIFKEFDKIVHVSYDNKRVFDEIVPEFSYKSLVVYNMYNIEHIKKMADEYPNPYIENGKKHIVTVCRLIEEQKKLSRILSSVLKLKNEGYNNFDWTIVGDGRDSVMYKRYVIDNELQDYVTFAGLKTNPYPYMKNADFFILSSLYEGFGMTIKEAQILGTPTFSTNFGPAHEAILEGKQGEICENSEYGVYELTKKMILNQELLEYYRTYIREHPVDNRIAISQFENVCK